MANEGYHEPIDELTDATRDMHRAIVSLMEELEAVDWYNQRVDACKDKELKAILAHNRDEEKEHAAMVGALKKGDEVALSSGMLGKISGLDDNYLTLSVSHNVELKFQKVHVTSVLPKGTLKSVGVESA